MGRVVGVSVCALTVVACGSSGHPSTGATPLHTGSAKVSTSTTVLTPAGRLPVVDVERTARYGNILVSPTGQVLYHLSSESSGGVGNLTCVGLCTEDWVPYLLPSGDIGPVAPNFLAVDLGVVIRPDGKRQITYSGEPLYTRAANAPTNTADTDGTWSVVKVSGAVPTPSTPGGSSTSVPATSVPATSVPATSVPATSVPATSAS